MSTARRVVVVCLTGLLALSGCSTGTSTSGSATTPGAASNSGSPSRHDGDARASTSPTRAHPGPPNLSARVLPWRLPSPLSRSVAFRLGGTALLAGGLQPGDRSTDQVLRVRLRDGTVSAARRLAVPLHDAAGAVVAGRPTVVGGGSSTELSDIQARRPDGSWLVSGQLPGARSDLSVVRVAGRLWVFGGYDGTSTPTTVLTTTDGAHVHAVGRLTHGVRYAGVSTGRGVVWLVGGELDGHELDSVVRVDTATVTGRQVSRLPVPLGHSAVVPVGDRLLVMGGRTSPSTVTDRMWWFTPRSGRWQPAGRLPTPVADAPVVTLGGTGSGSAYLFGGETPDFSDRVVRVSWGQ